MNSDPNRDQDQNGSLLTDSFLKVRALYRDNMNFMWKYFSALFSKDLITILDVLDENIESLIIPIGDTLKGKHEIETLAQNHWSLHRTE